MIKHHTNETIVGEKSEYFQSTKLNIIFNHTCPDSPKEKSLNLGCFAQNSNGPILKEDRKVIRNNKWVVSWTHQEDKMLFQKYIEEGSKWVSLSEYFPDKSINAVKNRFYSCIKKVHRKINSIQRQTKTKQNKLITYSSLLTILEIGKNHMGMQNKRFQEIRKNMDKMLNLRNSIIEMAVFPQQKIEASLVETVIGSFQELKHCLKFVNISRIRYGTKQSTLQKSPQNQILQMAVKDPIKQEKSCLLFQNDPTEPIRLFSEKWLISQSEFPLEGSLQPRRIRGKESESLFRQCEDVLKIEPYEEIFDYQFFI